MPALAVITPLAELVRRAQSGQTVYMSGLSWKEYTALLKELNGTRVRITFDQGRLEIMPISWEHGALSWLLNMLLFVWVEENNLSMCGGGQVTFSRRDLAKGLEPDQCYWIANVAQIRGKKKLDFRRDPPPDLALEIEVSRTVISRLDIYAALKVPEVWRCDETSIQVGLLQADGSYFWGQESAALSGFPFKKVLQALRRLDTDDHTTIVRRFRTWVRTHLPAAE
jgi:Uma2 family endonuclease